jgi:hypothetical protein
MHPDLATVAADVPVPTMLTLKTLKTPVVDAPAVKLTIKELPTSAPVVDDVPVPAILTIKLPAAKSAPAAVASPVPAIAPTQEVTTAKPFARKKRQANSNRGDDDLVEWEGNRVKTPIVEMTDSHDNNDPNSDCYIDPNKTTTLRSLSRVLRNKRRDRAQEQLQSQPAVSASVDANDLLVTVPQVFKSFPNWVTHKDATREGKAPSISGTILNASSSHASTWATYEVACANIIAGKGYTNLGFVTDGDRAGNLTGVDLDGCRNNRSGEITPWAQRILDLLGPTYVEITPSCDGLRAWVTGVIPAGENVFKLDLKAGWGDKVQVEVYSDRKYFCMTGKRYGNSPSAVAPLTDVDALLSLLRTIAVENPPTKTGKQTAVKEKKVKRTVEVKKPDGGIMFVAAPPDPGFKDLFDAVGWAPLERRMDKMSDERFHDLSLDTSALIYCPMPGHQPRSEDLEYTKCFGTIKDNPAVVSCFGCKWSGDLVSTIREFDGGEDGGNVAHKNNYDVARAICAEENLTFTDYFPPTLPATAAPATAVDNAAITGTTATAVATATVAIAEDEEGLVCESFADDVPELQEWLWDGHVPVGALTLYAGNPDVGKTLAALDLVARVTKGLDFPNGSQNPFPPSDVILCEAEDDPKKTLGPRLMVAAEDAGADMARVIRTKIRLRGGKKTRTLQLDKDLHHLEKTLTEHPECRLLVISPVSAYLGPGVKAIDDGAIRAILSPLQDMASRLEIAVVAIVHLNKSSDYEVIYRVSGAMGFVAVARASWLFAKDARDKQSDNRYMMPIKGNLAEKQKGTLYTVAVSEKVVKVLDKRNDCMVETTHPRVFWGDSTDVDPNEVMREPVGPRGAHKTDQMPAAIEWLEKLFKDSEGGYKPIPILDYRRAFRAVDFPENTVKRAMRKMGVEYDWSKKHYAVDETVLDPADDDAAEVSY